MARNKRLPFNLIQESRKTIVVGIVLAILAAYISGSKAIDTGSWLQYFLTFVLIVVSVKSITRFIKYDDKR